MPSETTIGKMPDDEIINVAFEDLSQEHKDLIEKATEEFQNKCLESFGKIRNKIIQKNPLPRILVPGKVDQDKDTEK